MRSKNIIDRITRWQLILFEFDFDITHVFEKKLTIVDEFSRIVDYLSISLKFFESTIIAFQSENELISTMIDVFLRNQKHEWKKWLNDLWYFDIIKFKLFEHKDDESLLLKFSRKITKKKIQRFLFVEKKTNSMKLTYREKKEKFNKCFYLNQIIKALIIFHNLCKHFSNRIIQQKCLKKYWWSTRFKNIFEYCRSCSNCQMLESLKSTKSLLSIVFMQSFDLLRTNFLKSFILIFKRKTRFIQTNVDYMSRYLFANAMSIATSKNAILFFEKKIISHFEYFRLIYNDNESHFKKNFIKWINNRKIKHIFAFIFHFEFVELTKKYNRLILQYFKVIFQHHFEMIFDWDFLFSSIINAINIKFIRLYEFVFVEILLKYKSKYLIETNQYENLLKTNVIEAKMLISIVSLIVTKNLIIKKSTLKHRLTKLNELKANALNRRFMTNEQLIEKKNNEKSRQLIKIKILMKLRRLTQNDQHNHKLKTRWENLYFVDKLAKHEKNLWLKKLHSNTIKKRYSINDVKIWIERTKNNDLNQHWKFISQINDQIRQKIKIWQKKKSKQRLKMIQKSDYDSNVNIETKKSFKKWWNTQSQIFIELYENEYEWNWWRDREKIVDFQSLSSLHEFENFKNISWITKWFTIITKTMNFAILKCFKRILKLNDFSIFLNIYVNVCRKLTTIKIIIIIFFKQKKNLNIKKHEKTNVRASQTK